MKEQLAVIEYLRFSYQDRGILTLDCTVSYEEGGGQMILNSVLCNPVKVDGETQRQGTAYGCELIRLFLDALNISNLDEANGIYIHVIGDGEGLSFEPIGIKTLKAYGKKTIIFKDVLNKFENEAK